MSHPSTTTNFKYRADIDGLRGIAVVLVLLFHADLGFPSGFIGVDVFFVISGFLITGLILKEQQSDSFRLTDFWLRRIRRIIPASSFVVLITLGAAFFILLPDDFAELGESTIAQQCMLSNVFFWRNTGYFDGAADLKPLLHTWSLAVEEQFYLGYPFLLVLLHKFHRRTMVFAMIVLTVASAGAYQYGMHHHPSATFYLLPTRAWELLFGGLLCFVPSKFRIHRRANDILSLLGLLAIALPAIMITRNADYQGIVTLIPCIGTVAFILANRDELTLAGKVVAAKPIVFVGLVSYSLYLWHWPILTLQRHLHIELYLEEPGHPSRIMGLIVCGALAIFSWRFIETPFRRKDLFTQNSTLVATAIGTTLLLLITAAGIVVSQGLPDRFDPQVITFASARTSQDIFNRVVTSEEIDIGRLPIAGAAGGKLKCLVWGDSHAMCLIAGLDTTCKDRSIEVLQATRYATVPLLGFEHKSIWNNEGADKFCQSAFDFAIAKNVDVVILSARWSAYAGWPTFESALKRTINELVQGGVHVAIVLDVADQESNVPWFFSEFSG